MVFDKISAVYFVIFSISLSQCLLFVSWTFFNNNNQKSCLIVWNTSKHRYLLSTFHRRRRKDREKKKRRSVCYTNSLLPFWLLEIETEGEKTKVKQVATKSKNKKNHVESMKKVNAKTAIDSRKCAINNRLECCFGFVAPTNFVIFNFVPFLCVTREFLLRKCSASGCEMRQRLSVAIYQ